MVVSGYPSMPVTEIDTRSDAEYSTRPDAEFIAGLIPYIQQNIQPKARYPAGYRAENTLIYEGFAAPKLARFQGEP